MRERRCVLIMDLARGRKICGLRRTASPRRKVIAMDYSFFLSFAMD